MKKKIISIYSIFFLFVFIFLFSLDYFYQNYVYNLKIDNKYTVNTTQVYNQKEMSLNKLLDDTIIGKKLKNNFQSEDFYQIKNLRTSNYGSHYTLNHPKTKLSFKLITKNYFDPDDLENELNKNYLSSVDYVINLIEKNSYLFDFASLSKEYENIKSYKTKLAYKNLTESDFFKKYPPAKCYRDNEFCLSTYAAYYNFILDQISINHNNMTSLKESLNLNIGNDKKNFEIIEDFFSYRHLFFLEDLNLDNKESYTNDQFVFFSNKYKKLLQSEIFNGMITLPNNICRTFRQGCFELVTDYLYSILKKHILEKENIFEVKQITNINKEKFNVVNQTIVIFGITLLITYVFFIFTNKFLRRKLK